MNFLKLFLFSGLLFLISSQTPAIGTVEPPIKRRAKIKVESFDTVTNSVEVKIVGEPAVGPNYTDPRVLARALGFKGKKASQMITDPNKFKGVILNLRSDLKLLNFFELTDRLPEHLKRKVKKTMLEGQRARLNQKKKSKNK